MAVSASGASSSDVNKLNIIAETESGSVGADSRRHTPKQRSTSPFVTGSMELLEHLSVKERNKVWFIHMNHTNPLLDVESKESKAVQSRGFNIAVEGIKLNL